MSGPFVASTRYRVDGWRAVESMSGREIERRIDYEIERLADDLRVCGQGYPSPRIKVIRELSIELARREVLPR